MWVRIDGMAVPDAPRRLRVTGVSGSGKTTFARALANRTGLPHLELDAVFWDAGWQRRDLDEARGMIRRFLAESPDGWVIDGNWDSKIDGILDPGKPGGADTIVWLDYARPRIMSRVIRRTLRRGILREELWHGNRERPGSWFSRDPHENIILWAWTTHAVVRERYETRIAQGEPIVRLRTPREARNWLAALIPAISREV